MATQVLQIELTEAIDPILVKDGYRYGRVLVRRLKIPVGWVSLSYQNKQIITADEILAAVKKQLGWLVVRSFLRAANENVDITTGFSPISIIVCTRNRTDFLSDCVNTLLKMRYPVYEIIIVDNAPLNDDTKTLVAELPVRYICEKRLGLNWARNRGLQEARYPIVAFTDDDAKVDEHWLYAINNAFRDENVKAVSGMVGPAELITKAQRMFELGYGGMGHGFDRKYFNRVLISNDRQLWASSFGIGANMAFRKEVFGKIGQFDVAFDVGTPSRGGGDVEMFFRLVNSGYTMLYDPAVLIWHMHRTSMEALWRQIEDNGKSTGCFLIHVFRQKKVRRLSVLRFFVVEWLWKWNIHNLLKKKKHFSRKLSLCELRGLIGSPYAYWSSQKKAKQIRLSTLEVS